MLKLVMIFIAAASLLQLSAGAKKNGCQSACQMDVNDCYDAAGYTFGTVKTGANTPRAILACNEEFSSCSRQCNKVGL